MTLPQETSQQNLTRWVHTPKHEREKITREIAQEEAKKETNIADPHTYSRVTCYLKNNTYCPQDYGYRS